MTTYVRSNNEPTKFLFNKRAFYNKENTSDYTCFTDFTQEKYMYGRVGRNFAPIYANYNNEGNFKTVPRTNSQQTNIRALNFVVDAFQDMVQKFQQAINNNKIDGEDKYLSNIKAYKGYEDPKRRYNNYINKYQNNLRSFIINQNIQISSFDDMVSVLLNGLEKNYIVNPFTFPAFIKARRTPITVSGLVIEIANLNKSNDDIKNELFFKSRNWDFYLNMAQNYGFMVDARNPWRLVADIGSSEMLKYASRYGATTTDEVLNQYFTEPGPSFFLNLPLRMYNMYNALKPNFFTEIEMSGVEIKRPKNYSNLDSFLIDYGIDYFIDLYCRMRYTEEENREDEVKIRKSINDIIQAKNLRGKNAAIDIFEGFVNKPFEYSNSLNYNIQNGKARPTYNAGYKSNVISIKTLK